MRVDGAMEGQKICSKKRLEETGEKEDRRCGSKPTVQVPPMYLWYDGNSNQKRSTKQNDNDHEK